MTDVPTLILVFFAIFLIRLKWTFHSVLQIRKVDAKKIGTGWKPATVTYFEVVF